MEIKKIKFIEEVYDREKNKSKRFITMGDKIDLTIKDFNIPIGEKSYKKTTYVVYICYVNSRNGEPINEEYPVQFPVKSVWCKLYALLKSKGNLYAKEVHVEITKKTTYTYEIKLLSLDGRYIL